MSIVDDLYDGNFGSDLFKIDQKKAMDFALSAWDQVSEKTILNSWGHTGIVPGVKRSTTTPVTEMGELAKAMKRLGLAAADRSLAFDVPTAKEYVDNGESDELPLVGNLSIEEICEFVCYVDEEDEIETNL